MFANLTEKLTKALRDLRGLSKLTEDNIAPALVEVRSALMSADVNFKVAKDFTERVKAACLGTAVVDSVNPGQMAVKVVSDELTKLLGEGERPIDPRRPLRVLLVGLQGSGKTTSAAKRAKHLVKKEGLRKPSLVAADLRRPAAIDQLETLAKNEGFDFRADRAATDVAAMVGRLVKEAEAAAADLVIVDTAGRLQVDGELMEEVRRVRDAFQPHEVFLVADAALGHQGGGAVRPEIEAFVLRERLELVDGGRSAQVGRDEGGLAEAFLLHEVLGELGGAGGLAGALEAVEEHE